jgi:L-ascorbate metabolism protein UlaG (beta-lactamase superfamily)
MLEPFRWYKQSAIRWQGAITVHIDPWGIPAGEPTADLVLITHAHFDHFSAEDLDRVRAEGTVVVAPEDVAGQIRSGDVRAVRPGQTIEAKGLRIEAVPAYNVAPERRDFHPRDNNWVGYVVDLGGTRTYLAGDTDHIPEMREVRADLAFVPIGGTYTMDVAEAAAAVKEMAPRVAVPYHFGFVVGSRRLGEEFVRAIAPIEGRVLEPVNPFEQP